MPIITPLKVICSQISETKYASLRELARADSAVVNVSALDAAILESVRERLDFAGELLAAANRELANVGGTYDIGGRNAMSRGYYTLHHTCRAVVLYEKRYDPFEHPGAISAFAGVVKSVRFLETKLGKASAEVETELTAFRLRRNDADYHVYGSATAFQSPVDFVASGQEVCIRARVYLDAALDYVSKKEAGVI